MLLLLVILLILGCNTLQASTQEAGGGDEDSPVVSVSVDEAQLLLALRRLNCLLMSFRC